MNAQTQKPKRTVLKGEVVSNSMQDTALVAVTRFEKHPKYGKYQRKTKRYKAHDAGNTAEVGDKVFIESCRPISKDKHFRIVQGK